MRFSAPVQTGLGTHRTSFSMHTGPFPGIKQPGRGVNHSPLSNAEVKEMVELYLCSLSVPSWHVGRCECYVLYIDDIQFHVPPALIIVRIRAVGAHW